MRKALHLMFGGSTRFVLVFAALALLIAGGPFIAGWFDDRGIPGGTIVLFGLALGACASGFAFFFTMTPRTEAEASAAQVGRRIWSSVQGEGLVDA